MKNPFQNNHPRILTGIYGLTSLVLLGLIGCMTDTEKQNKIDTKQPYLFAITSDYSTGALKAYNIGTGLISDFTEGIHSDAVVRYLGGDDIYVINRMGRDNVMVFDRHSLKMVQQIPFPALSNPQDIAVKDSLMYVAFYGLSTIGIYHQRDGEAKGEIDLTAYADDGDKIPETTALLFVGNELYAITGNLDTKNGYKPMQAHLLKIDVTTKTVTQSIDLPFTNPRSLAYDIASGRIYIPCSGTLSDLDNKTPLLDGGIVSINVNTFAITDTLATEMGLAGTVNSLVLNGGVVFMGLSVAGSAGSEEHVLAIGLKDGKSKLVTTLGSYQLGGIAIDGPSSTLFIGDKKNGLRLFDLTTYQEKAVTKVKFDPPTTDLVIIR